MKILVLGSTGFIGSNITSYYLDKHTILSPKRIDILDSNFILNFIKNETPDVVINCISYGGKENVNLTKTEDITNNLILFSNIVNASKYFKKYINLGSGIELNSAQSVWENIPSSSSYAISKNIISRFCDNLDKFYTLRLYGCFGINEPEFRIFSKYKKSIGNELLEISDKYFDNFYIKDFLKVLDYYIYNNNLIKDVHCVYNKKLKLSEQLSLLSKVLNCQDNYLIKEIGNNYIGNSNTLDKINLKLIGLEEGLWSYK